MNDPDPEFEEFLARRKPLFRREVDDGLEPPAELDRIVLGKARRAIEPDQPLRMYRGPRWAAPMAVAATLILGVGVVFYAGTPAQLDPKVRVENASQRIVQPATDSTLASPPAPATASATTPAWRRDPKTWMAEIDRLRAAGDTARAEAELAEFNRQNRAYATSPDR